MRLSFIYAVALLCISFASCSHPYGKYVVIKVDGPNSGNDTINNLLRNRLQDKEFDISFTDEYALMVDGDHNKAYLTIEKAKNHFSVLYKKIVTLHRVTYTASLLTKEDKRLMYILRVDGRTSDIFSPVQLGNYPPWGEARCWLVKIDK